MLCSPSTVITNVSLCKNSRKSLKNEGNPRKNRHFRAYRQCMKLGKCCKNTPLSAVRKVEPLLEFRELPNNFYGLQLPLQTAPSTITKTPKRPHDSLKVVAVVAVVGNLVKWHPTPHQLLTRLFQNSSFGTVLLHLGYFLMCQKNSHHQSPKVGGVRQLGLRSTVKRGTQACGGQRTASLRWPSPRTSATAKATATR
jgi:hypothetical protein